MTAGIAALNCHVILVSASSKLAAAQRKQASPRQYHIPIRQNGNEGRNLIQRQDIQTVRSRTSQSICLQPALLSRQPLQSHPRPPPGNRRDSQHPLRCRLWPRQFHSPAGKAFCERLWHRSWLADDQCGEEYQ